MLRSLASLYSKRSARAQDFNAKIGFEKYASRPEILTKLWWKLKVWFGKPKFITFWQITRATGHIFQNRFLCWNPELKPNVLSIMKPMNRTNFFLPYNGPSRIKKANWGGLKFLQISSNFYCAFIIYIVMGKWFAFNDFQ